MKPRWRKAAVDGFNPTKHGLNVSLRGAVRALLRDLSFEFSNDGTEHSACEATCLFLVHRVPN